MNEDCCLYDGGKRKRASIGACLMGMSNCGARANEYKNRNKEKC